MRTCVIVPSRSRPQNLDRLAEAFTATNASADLYAVLDIDDESIYTTRFAHLYQHNNTGGSAKALNWAAKQLLDSGMYGHYEYFVFMGDDHLPKTLNWDKELIKPLRGTTGIAYGNDLLQGENLPTAFVMSRDIVEALDGMTFPGCIHLYFDNFVKQLGIDIGALYYMPNVIIEHLHPVAGKAEVDEGYARVNQPKFYEEDLLTLQKYLRSQDYADLVNKLK
jgi:hypothetical protein